LAQLKNKFKFTVWV